VLVKAINQEIVLANNIKKITILSIGAARKTRRTRKSPIVSDNSSNIHRAINVTTLTDKEIKKYSLVKVGDSFKKDDLVLLYDDQYVKISEGNRLLKYKVLKENTVYRRK
jgi:hypothetical protein